MSSSLIAANLACREERPSPDRPTFENPLTNTYKTADGRWLVFAMMQADRYWPGFCKAIGHEELIDDPRFADMPSRGRNAQACISTLDAIFATKPLAEWREVLAQQEGRSRSPSGSATSTATSRPGPTATCRTSTTAKAAS